MARLILFVACAIVSAIALYKLFRFVRTREWDWMGIGLAVAFILLAIYLRMATGIGGVAEG